MSASSTYSLEAPLASSADSDAQLLEISLGPQHPSTHGVYLMNVVLDGDREDRLKPVFG